jgi:hypothetical protein
MVNEKYSLLPMGLDSIRTSGERDDSLLLHHHCRGAVVLEGIPGHIEPGYRCIGWMGYLVRHFLHGIVCCQWVSIPSGPVVNETIPFFCISEGMASSGKTDSLLIDHAKDHAKGGSQALKKGQVITGKIGYEKAETFNSLENVSKDRSILLEAP